jgi:hypothetical protein
VTTELVKGLVALIVALVGVGVGWKRIQDHGAEREKRQQAEEDADAAEKRVEMATEPPASRSEAARILRRRLQRIARRMRH